MSSAEVGYETISCTLLKLRLNSATFLTCFFYGITPGTTGAKKGDFKGSQSRCSVLVLVSAILVLALLGT